MADKSSNKKHTILEIDTLDGIVDFLEQVLQECSDDGLAVNASKITSLLNTKLRAFQLGIEFQKNERENERIVAMEKAIAELKAESTARKEGV